MLDHRSTAVFIGRRSRRAPHDQGPSVFKTCRQLCSGTDPGWQEKVSSLNYELRCQSWHFTIISLCQFEIDRCPDNACSYRTTSLINNRALHTCLPNSASKCSGAIFNIQSGLRGCVGVQDTLYQCIHSTCQWYAISIGTLLWKVPQVLVCITVSKRRTLV